MTMRIKIRAKSELVMTHYCIRAHDGERERIEDNRREVPEHGRVNDVLCLSRRKRVKILKTTPVLAMHALVDSPSRQPYKEYVGEDGAEDERSRGEHR